MQKAIENIRLILGEQSATLAQRWFERAQDITKVNRAFRRIESTKDKEQLLDYLAEMRYALFFIGLGFEVGFEPAGNRGADLGIARDGEKAVVEIMRFRKINSDLQLLNLDDENLILPKYGNIPRDIRKAFDKILGKFRQIESQKGIIAIWNDDEELEEIETSAAVYDICNDVNLFTSDKSASVFRFIYTFFGDPHTTDGLSNVTFSPFLVKASIFKQPFGNFSFNSFTESGKWAFFTCSLTLTLKLAELLSAFIGFSKTISVGF